MHYPIMTTACGQCRVQDCLCGDCEALDTPESNANQDQRRQLEARTYFYAEANAGLHDSYDSMIEP